MKKFKELPIYKQALRVYFLSIIVSLVFSPIFLHLYIWIYRPFRFGGGLFMPISDSADKFISGAFLAYIFFLSVFIFLLMERKYWRVWIIGAIFPLLLAVEAGLKPLFWELLIAFAGWLLARLVLLIKNRRTNLARYDKK